MGMSKKDFAKIRQDIYAQMNLAQDLVNRNPWLSELNEKYPNHFILKGSNLEKKTSKLNELDKRFAEIYGDVFPTHPFPIEMLNNNDKIDPSKLLLKIDLNYTKDELRAAFDGFMVGAHNNYLKNKNKKIQRKYPKKWINYLEIWDLRDGFDFWIRDSEGIPLAPSMKKLKRRMTYEEIAKRKYPDALSPKELEKAIDRVKKQYRAAFKLICGKKYKAKELDKIRSSNDKLCDECESRADCKEACPALLKALKNEEISEQNLVVAGTVDMEKYETTGKKALSSDQQFK